MRARQGYPDGVKLFPSFSEGLGRQAKEVKLAPVPTSTKTRIIQCIHVIPDPSTNNAVDEEDTQIDSRVLLQRGDAPSGGAASPSCPFAPILGG